ncbi:MAG TPA: proteasome subunit alpha, partial [Methylomirabilota bacterium]
KRRIFGLENEYGLTCTLNGQRRLSPDNVARYLFEKVIPGARNEIYHILYDGTIEDERNYAAMGGQSDEIRRFLKDHHKEGMPLDEALQLGVRALTVTQNKTLTEKDLEVAVLDRTKARRKFRRIPLEALGQLLGTAR